MDPITIAKAALYTFFFFSERAGKTREERNTIYEDAREEFNALPSPARLKDTVE